MATIRVETELAASPTDVWADIRHIETHAEWMHDAVAVRITGASREGEGTTFEADTKVGPIRLTDQMQITEWVEEEVMGVRHVGLVTGVGRFTLAPVGADRTRFTWEETLTFPWWLGGPIGGVVGGWILKWVWRRNLRDLADRFATRPPADR